MLKALKDKSQNTNLEHNPHDPAGSLHISGPWCRILRRVNTRWRRLSYHTGSRLPFRICLPFYKGNRWPLSITILQQRGQMEPIAGRRIYDVFQFTKVLGYGTFGEVSRIVSVRDSNAMFALKTLNLEQCVDLRFLYMECYALQILKHPHIVRYYGSHWDLVNKRAYILTEYCALSDLFYHIGRISGPTRSLTVMDQVTNGLMHIHKMGYAHRDLKPENIFMDTSGNVKIGDFGFIFKAVDKKGRKIHTTSPCGSDSYMAPEVFHGDLYQPQMADMWSLGVVWMVIYLGDGLWEKPSAQVPLYQQWVNNSKNTPWDNVDKLILQTLRSLMNIEPERRPTSYQLQKRITFLKQKILGPGDGYECTQVSSQQAEIEESEFDDWTLSKWHRTSFSQPARLADLSFSQPCSQPQQQPNTINKRMFRMTRFYVDTPLVRSACSYIQEVLARSKLEFKQESESDFTIKQGNVQLRIEVVQLCKEGCSKYYCLVDIRRLKGDGFHFQKIYNHIKSTFEKSFTDMYIPVADMSVFEGKGDTQHCQKADGEWNSDVWLDIELFVDPPLPDPECPEAAARGFKRPSELNNQSHPADLHFVTNTGNDLDQNDDIRAPRAIYDRGVKEVVESRKKAKPVENRKVKNVTANGRVNKPKRRTVKKKK